MPSNKIEIFGPTALTASVANLVAPAAAGAGGVGYTPTATVIYLRHIRIVNKTGGAQTFSLWKGATGASAAGTEVVGTAMTVPANSAVDWYGAMRLAGANGFLTGVASAATSLTFEAEGELGFE